MRSNEVFFWLLGVFFGLSAVLYTVFHMLTYDGEVEWAGSVALALSAMLGGFIAYYLRRVYKAQGGELPEDRYDAGIDDGDPEIGHFSPWSWWPFLLAGGAGIALLGFGVGVWVTFIGVPIAGIAIIGWVFEYYRGYHAR